MEPQLPHLREIHQSEMSQNCAYYILIIIILNFRFEKHISI